jgi:hypothetical protein
MNRNERIIETVFSCADCGSTDLTFVSESFFNGNTQAWDTADVDNLCSAKCWDCNDEVDVNIKYVRAEVPEQLTINLGA